jgi:CubicO group peptidase (beta-lactamase class C family)
VDRIGMVGIVGMVGGPALRHLGHGGRSGAGGLVRSDHVGRAAAGETGPVNADALVEEVGKELPRWQVPGLQLAAVREGEVLFAGGVGVRGMDDPAPVTPATLFLHGSCLKAYTSLLATDLAAAKALDLDVPVRRYVPELELPDPVVAQRVTLRDLLSHRSGLGRHDLAWIFNPSWTREELVERLRHLPLAQDFRVGMSYSNVGYALAGLAIGRATGSTWAEQLRERVLAPAGMERTWTTLEPMRSDPERAQGHLRAHERVTGTDYREFEAVAPAGQLVTCAEDAARWLLLQLGTGAGDDGAGPDTAAVEATHQLAITMAAVRGPTPELRVFGYALGWAAGTFRGRPMLTHAGGIDGFLTQTLLLPEQQIGVVASANLGESSLPTATMLQVTDGLLGETGGRSWYDRVRDIEAAAKENEPGQPAGDARPDAGPPSQSLTAFAATYPHPGYGDLVVTAEDERLHVRLGEYELEPRHRHYDTWDLRYRPLDQEFPLTFVTDADGVVAEAVSPLDPQSDPIRFRRAR